MSQMTDQVWWERDLLLDYLREHGIERTDSAGRWIPLDQQVRALVGRLRAVSARLEATIDRIEAEKPAICAAHMLEGKRRGLRMAADECAAQSAALLEELKEASNHIADELDSMECHLRRLADSGELR